MTTVASDMRIWFYCDHSASAPQWHGAGGAFTWPVLLCDDARWAARAAIDAVVAHTYGLTREQYAHILSTFSHSSYKAAPRQCFVAFDDLQQISLEFYTKQHDCYWDIPLNENLPRPVIDLPIPIANPAEIPKFRTGELFHLEIPKVGNTAPEKSSPASSREQIETSSISAAKPGISFYGERGTDATSDRQR